jgi:hypothetical protein
MHLLDCSWGIEIDDSGSWSYLVETIESLVNGLREDVKRGHPGNDGRGWDLRVEKKNGRV